MRAPRFLAVAVVIALGIPAYVAHAAPPAEPPAPLEPPPPPPPWPEPQTTASTPTPPSPSTSTAPPTPASPPARSRSHHGITLGVRIGYSIPLGYTNDHLLSDITSGALPAWVDAGYRFSPRFYAGAEFSYSPAFASTSSNSTCPSQPDIGCSGSQYRFGLDTAYHFEPDRTFDPWVGLGLGVEILNFSATDSSGATVSSEALSGPLAHLGLGLDLHTNPLVDVGPFVDIAGAEYTSSDASGNSLHWWLTFGVRATLNP